MADSKKKIDLNAEPDNELATATSGDDLAENSSKTKFSKQQGAKSATRIYLEEIGDAALLSRKEEIALAKRIHAGDEAARKRMIESNLRIVVAISRKYVNCGLDFADIIMEGNLGLMHAVEKFDPDKGFRFSTYATYWIRHYIERAIMNQSRTVRLPIHIIRELSSYRRKAMKLQKKLEHKATDQDLAEIIDQPLERIRKVLSFGGEALSLDAPMFSDNGEAGISFVDNLEDDSQIDPITTLEDEDLRRIIQGLMNSLDKDQYDVLVRRFGFKTGERMTLDSIAKELGLTRERVRQLQDKALRVLRRRLFKQGMDKDLM